MFSSTPKLFKNILALATLYLTVFLVMLPQSCLSAAKSGINLCLNSIIPSLFPFFVCSGILSASGISILCSKVLSGFMRPLFRLPGAGAMTFLLGTVSGYPVGAASATELYLSGQCTKTEAERMTAFCNNTSPMFIIGVVGTGFLGSPHLGYILYASHITAALLVGIMFRFYGKPTSSERRSLPSAGTMHTKKTAIFTLGGIIDSAVFSTLKVCGFIIFFSVFSEAIPKSGLKPYICSLIEISGGLRIFTQDLSQHFLLLPLISLFLGFSGLSVLLQISSIISPHGLSNAPLIAGKILQGIFSFAITLVITKIVPISEPTFLFGQEEFLGTFSVTDFVLASVLSAFFVVVILKGATRLSLFFQAKSPK